MKELRLMALVAAVCRCSGLGGQEETPAGHFMRSMMTFKYRVWLGQDADGEIYCDLSVMFGK
jgi:hypothetical protein